MRVLICGDRKWTDKETIEAYIKTLEPGSVVIQGKCRGADWIARTFALKHRYKVEDYPAKWELYGRAAGPMRNTQMLMMVMMVSFSPYYFSKKHNNVFVCGYSFFSFSMFC